jgi:hypothetical protein
LIDSLTWYNVDTENCILYVPANSVDEYRNAPVWSEFKHILADSLLVSTKIELQLHWSMFPNPAIDQVNIHGSGGLISVFDLNGRLVFKQTVETNGSFQVRSLKPGLYVVRLHTKEGMSQHKLIKV